MAKLTLPLVRQQLEASLGRAAKYFTKNAELANSQAEADAETAANLNMVITKGLGILNQLKPLRGEIILNLTANKNRYELPSTTLDIIKHNWGREQLKAFKPWQPHYPRNLPSVKLQDGDTTQAVLSVPPTVSSINALGAFMPLEVAQQWAINETGGTVEDKHTAQVLKACEAAAMLSILTSRVGDPLKNQQAKNLNPKAAYDTLMHDLKAWAAG